MADGFECTECRGFGLATVMLRRTGDAAAMGAALKMAVPLQPACVSGETLTLIGTGPGMWLAFAETSTPYWASDLGARLPGTSISDQSGGYVVFRMSGTRAGDLLQRGAFIDFDPAVFRAGSAATTVIAHIGVIIWKSDDAPVFHVAVFRSFATSFLAWVSTVSAQLEFCPRHRMSLQ